MKRSNSCKNADTDYGLDLWPRYVGRFSCFSGRLIVSDPCYSIEEHSHCLGIIDDAAIGEWDVILVLTSVSPFGAHIAQIMVQHESMRQRYVGIEEFTGECFDVGVDSGQVGIFDALAYRNEAIASRLIHRVEKPIDSGDAFYSLCCDATMRLRGGTFPFGAVTTSGFGDGCYRALIHKRDELVVAVNVQFIDCSEGGAS